MTSGAPPSFNSEVSRIFPVFFHPAFFALLSFAATVTLNNRAILKPEVKYLNPPPEQIELMHFGFKESLADSLWLRWVQDNDTCQTYGSEVLYNLEPMPKETPKDSLLWLPRHKICENSWSFKMLDAVTKLSPKFEMPYLAGASTLAILVEDFAGATVIYERGLKEYPDNWQLLYRASFHFQYNMKNLPRAAELLLQVADKGGPIWTRSLASRLYTVDGQVALAISVLENYRKSLDEDNLDGKRMVDQRLAELRRKLNSPSRNKSP